MLIPPKLKSGDEVRIVAPARSLSLIGEDCQKIACEYLTSLGLKISFGQHVSESDEFHSSSITSRVADLHDAFRDPNVKAILSVIGGFNSNQLLPYLDFDLIKSHPKIFCGYSDISVLSNAIFAKTGLVTYLGTHFSTLGMKLHNEYTKDYFEKCFLSDESYEIFASKKWSEDLWFLDQANRTLQNNRGAWIIQKGSVEGQVVGGNLSSISLLSGTEFLPHLSEILLVEECTGATPFLESFERQLIALTQNPDFKNVQALLIGRFQTASEMTYKKLLKILANPVFANLVIVANLDFGHTSPLLTLPIGGRLRIEANDCVKLTMLAH